MAARSLWGPRVWGRAESDFTVVLPDPVACGALRSGAERVPRRLVIRPVRMRDHLRIDRVRMREREWLEPWEATLPPGSPELVPDLWTHAREVAREQARGSSLVLLAEVDGEVAGLFSLVGVQRLAMSQGVLGYWVSQRWARRGLGSFCVAVMLDLVIGQEGLHRVEVNVRPEIEASLGLCERLGLRREGVRERFMCVAGAWRDHALFAADAESVPEGGFVASGWGIDLW